jgi:hypothetical protein
MQFKDKLKSGSQTAQPWRLHGQSQFRQGAPLKAVVWNCAQISNWRRYYFNRLAAYAKYAQI